VYERIPAWVRTAVRTRQLFARILLALDRPAEAAPVLDALGADGHLDAAMGLHLGEALLHRWNESGRRSHAHLRKAFEMYRTCYHRTSDVYAGLHAAALARFLDENAESAAIAAELLEAERDVQRPTAHEALAIGGAYLLSGRSSEALTWFEHAVAYDPDDAEDIAGMHRVILLINEKAASPGKEIEERIATIFHVPGVAAFAGPHIDADNTEPTDDTEDRVVRVRQRIRSRLDAMDAGHGVCSAGDRFALAFAEEVLERGGRLDLVLPYDADAFAYAGIPAEEVERFDRVIAHAKVRLHELDHVPGLDREAAHRDSEARVRDLARQRAEARNGKASVLVIRAEETAPPASVEPAPTSPEPPAPDVVTTDASPESASRMRDLGRRRKEQPTAIPSYRKVHALVVGVDAYEHWPHLANATTDAKGVADALEQKYGAYVRRLENSEATTKRIEEVIKNVLRQEVEADDLVVFYFAGHGQTERLGNDVEHGFLVPVDAREDNVADLMPLQDVTAWTEYLNCRHVLYILDACFSGFAGQAGGVTRRGGAHEARIAISAGTAEQAVFDGGAEGGWTDHSVFTGYLLRGLETELTSGDRPIDETMLIGYLRENVLRATRGKQTPVYGFLPGHGSDYIRLVPRESK
jgi:tetratricopeptide (TPR) repeat protein